MSAYVFGWSRSRAGWSPWYKLCTSVSSVHSPAIEIIPFHTRLGYCHLLFQLLSTCVKVRSWGPDSCPPRRTVLGKWRPQLHEFKKYSTSISPASQHHKSNSNLDHGGRQPTHLLHAAAHNSPIPPSPFTSTSSPTYPPRRSRPSPSPSLDD